VFDKKNKDFDPGNDPLLRELQEEIYRERYAKLWERYGVYALAAAVAVIAAVGGYQFWERRRLALAESAGAAYDTATRAIDSEKNGGATDGALKSLETLAREGPAGYAALARLQLAGAYAASGRTAEAVSAYQALANAEGTDRTLRDFARLQAAAARAGDAPWTEMENRLNELLAEGNPWQTAARELWGLAALKAGKTAGARDAFSQLLADPRTPQDMRERASMALATLVAADGEKASPAPAPAGEEKK